MLPPEIAREVSRLSDEFGKLAGLGWRGIIVVERSKIIVQSFGPPIDDEGEAYAGGGDIRAGYLLNYHRLGQLCTLGGQLLSKAHDAGWQPTYWPFIGGQSTQMRWSAFLMTGIRDYHVQKKNQGERTRCWIDEFSQVCEVACGDLLAVECDAEPSFVKGSSHRRKSKGLNKIDQATIIVWRNPEWTDKKIADEVPCSASLLSKSGKYRESAEKSRERSRQARTPPKKSAYNRRTEQVEIIDSEN